MKKIGELEGKPIVTDEYAPSRGDVIWKDPSDEKFKEAIDGEWADSPKIPSGGGESFYKDFLLKKDTFSYTFDGTEEYNQIVGHTNILDDINTDDCSAYIYKDVYDGMTSGHINYISNNTEISMCTVVSEGPKNITLWLKVSGSQKGDIRLSAGGPSPSLPIPTSGTYFNSSDIIFLYKND